MFEIEYAKSPVFLNGSKTAILLVVKFTHMNEEVPFTAIPNDVESHGQELFARAMAGEFGVVGDFVEAEGQPTVEGAQQL